MNNVLNMDEAMGNMKKEISTLSNQVKADVVTRQQELEARAMQRDDKVAQTIETKVKDLYKEFLKLTGSRGEDVDSAELSLTPDQASNTFVYDTGLLPRMLDDKQKIEIMEQAIALENGGLQLTEVFNSFYA